MAQSDKFVDIPPLFLPKYPFGSNLTGGQMLAFIREDTPADHPIRAALIHDRPVTRAKTLLSAACYAADTPQPMRFTIETVDAKRSLFTVVAQFDTATTMATESLFNSVTAAMRPYRAAFNEIDVVKVDELTDEQRRALEAQRKLVESRAAPLRQVYQTQIKSEWREAMKALGIDAAVADRLLNTLPEFQRYQKMLTVTS